MDLAAEYIINIFSKSKMGFFSSIHLFKKKKCLMIKRVKTIIKTRVTGVTGCSVLSPVAVTAVPWYFSENCLFVFTTPFSR